MKIKHLEWIGLSLSGSLLLASAALLFRSGAHGQVLREYIRLGDRVVAIETTAVGTSTIQVTGSWTNVTTNALFTSEDVFAGGASQVGTVGLLINNSLSGVNACYVKVSNAGAGSLSSILFNDDGTGEETDRINSQCQLADAARVSVQDNKLVWTATITFLGTFAGSSKIVYGFAQNGNGAYDWSALGTWNPSLPILMLGAKPGVFRSGYFWVLDVDGNGEFNSTTSDRAFAFGGVPGDIPITGDWNGNGKTKVGVFRPGNGGFVLDYDGDDQFSLPNDRFYQFLSPPTSGPPDVPVVGDWNGDGRTKVGIFRAGYFWVLDRDGNGVYTSADNPGFGFGDPSQNDKPIVGDWTGNGRSKAGLFRQGFLWLLDANGNGAFDGGDLSFAFGGVAGDVPVAADWSGDGTAKVGVFRGPGVPNYFWVLDYNGDRQFTAAPPDRAFAFGGISGDKPVTGRW